MASPWHSLRKLELELPSYSLINFQLLFPRQSCLYLNEPRPTEIRVDRIVALTRFYFAQRPVTGHLRAVVIPLLAVGVKRSYLESQPADYTIQCKWRSPSFTIRPAPKFFQDLVGRRVSWWEAGSYTLPPRAP